MGPLQCWQNLDYLCSSGMMLLHHLSMCEIAVAHPPLRMAHLTNRHMITSQTSAIFAFGDALPMCMCRRIREGHLDHIWRSVCSLGIQQDTRGGNSTIQLPRRPSSVNEQSLMKGPSFLNLPSPPSHPCCPIHNQIQW